MTRYRATTGAVVITTLYLWGKLFLCLWYLDICDKHTHFLKRHHNMCEPDGVF